VKTYKEGLIRWFTLFNACVFLVGSYFCYDNPGPIETTMEADLGISKTQWSLLYSVYSYPNIVLPVFGGIFLDKIGLRYFNVSKSL
jgi:nitrate/nitrite transporter NarK